MPKICNTETKVPEFGFTNDNKCINLHVQDKFGEKIQFDSEFLNLES
jgi:hypothetical protein